MKRLFAVVVCAFLLFSSASIAETENAQLYTLGEMTYSVPEGLLYTSEVEDGVHVNYHLQTNECTESIIAMAIYDDYTDCDKLWFYETVAVEFAEGSEYSLEFCDVKNASGCLLKMGEFYGIGEEASASFMYLTDECFYCLSFLSDVDGVEAWDVTQANIQFGHIDLDFDLSTLTDSELSSLSAEITITRILTKAGGTGNRSRIVDVDYSMLSSEEIDMLSEAIETEINARTSTDNIEYAKEQITDFFASCAKHGIYFDSTQPANEIPGSNNVKTLVHYESGVDGVRYDPFIRLMVDGSVQYGISSTSYHGTTDKQIYKIFVSVLLDIDEQEAETFVDDVFMKSYLADDTANICEESYDCAASFTDRHRFLYLTIK